MGNKIQGLKFAPQKYVNLQNSQSPRFNGKITFKYKHC